MDSIKMIKDLAAAFGAPGFEDDVVAIARQYAPTGSKIVEDNLRNLYICPKNEENPNLPTVLIDAHSDETSLMVQAIKPNGTLVFISLGDWVPNVLPSQKMSIKNLDGQFVTGVVATKPPHFGIDEGPLSIHHMVIDIGASSKEEVENDFKIAPACPIVPATVFEHDTQRDIMISKAFDCRLGCAAVLEVLENIKDTPLGVNIVGALSAQEEVGIRGAKVVANRVKPDIAICFEGTPADDTFAEPHLIQTRLKHGPMLRHIDRGMITHPRFMRFTLNLAKKLGIPVQEAVRTGGSTNGAAYHLSNLGIPTIVIGQPVRYIHSPHSIACMEDYHNTVRLATEMVKALNAEIIASL
ncbi:MAG: M20/M25/M40 family metallo-hydrolase [Defluviitaleaceae bacterium]|nr:M20/M25/M40 family metallo-hydrolase [Defluviitaleaceae bacterium]